VVAFSILPLKIPQRLGNLDARPKNGGGEQDARQYDLNLAEDRHGQHRSIHGGHFQDVQRRSHHLGFGRFFAGNDMQN